MYLGRLVSMCTHDNGVQKGALERVHRTWCVDVVNAGGVRSDAKGGC